MLLLQSVYLIAQLQLFQTSHIQFRNRVFDMASLRVVRAFRSSLTSAYLIVISWFVHLSSADGVIPCRTSNDNQPGNAQHLFYMTEWIRRGWCIRSINNASCYPTLSAVLLNLNNVRSAEYSGAAGLLALLPTIDAILGSPTNEVWTLLNVLPVGGALGMALSFGGAIMPVRVDDYETSTQRRNDTIGSIVRIKEPKRDGDTSASTRQLDLLAEKVTTRVADARRLRPGKMYITLGYLSMFLLFGASQAAMGVVEQGGVLPFCYYNRNSRNLVQLPFTKQHKLYVSRVPYDINMSGGESIFTDLQRAQNEPENVGIALEQLHTMPAAKVSFTGSTQFTQSRSTVMILVSVVGSKRWKEISRPLIKLCSVAVFVVGTAFFASVTLVALPMAVAVLTLVLSAGVFGRAIAGWLVRRVSETEPMIHVIVNSDEEANLAVYRILKLKLPNEANVQVEISGHVFVNGRRVDSRSKWPVYLLGVLANPYDLRRLKDKSPDDAPLLSNGLRNSSVPFLPK
ncbi:hypothetical protein K491DRAFT_755536 [Lophiostoma macrostomum CBS 122681]|uniref:Uncharacterized protein n=1 Tax=Lophiostoma macrostomum CBS 122681 TaxID=1314788 RepID=A0A6A6TK34_9PLEO|nr:hypothetical protein K491DRAFT_755536 [Lophiostoma macrostomum CBS 122681]